MDTTDATTTAAAESEGTTHDSSPSFDALISDSDGTSPVTEVDAAVVPEVNSTQPPDELASHMLANDAIENHTSTAPIVSSSSASAAPSADIGASDVSTSSPEVETNAAPIADSVHKSPTPAVVSIQSASPASSSLSITPRITSLPSLPSPSPSPSPVSSAIASSPTVSPSPPAPVSSPSSKPSDSVLVSNASKERLKSIGLHGLTPNLHGKREANILLQQAWTHAQQSKQILNSPFNSMTFSPPPAQTASPITSQSLSDSTHEEITLSSISSPPLASSSSIDLHRPFNIDIPHERHLYPNSSGLVARSPFSAHQSPSSESRGIVEFHPSHSPTNSSSSVGGGGGGGGRGGGTITFNPGVSSPHERASRSPHSHHSTIVSPIGLTSPTAPPKSYLAPPPPSSCCSCSALKLLVAFAFILLFIPLFVLLQSQHHIDASLWRFRFSDSGSSQPSVSLDVSAYVSDGESLLITNTITAHGRVVVESTIKGANGSGYSKTDIDALIDASKALVPTLSTKTPKQSAAQKKQTPWELLQIQDANERSVRDFLFTQSLDRMRSVEALRSVSAQWEWDSFWRDGFEMPENYLNKVAPLFTNAAFPPLAATSSNSNTPQQADSNGIMLSIHGRYKDDPIPAAPNNDPKSEAFYSFKYKVCSFENVCLNAANPMNMYFHFNNLKTYLHYAYMFAQCPGGVLHNRVGTFRGKKKPSPKPVKPQEKNKKDKKVDAKKPKDSSKDSNEKKKKVDSKKQASQKKKAENKKKSETKKKSEKSKSNDKKDKDKKQKAKDDDKKKKQDSDKNHKKNQKKTPEKKASKVSSKTGGKRRLLEAEEEEEDSSESAEENENEASEEAAEEEPTPPAPTPAPEDDLPDLEEDGSDPFEPQKMNPEVASLCACFHRNFRPVLRDYQFDFPHEFTVTDAGKNKKGKQDRVWKWDPMLLARLNASMELTGDRAKYIKRLSLREFAAIQAQIDAIPSEIQLPSAKSTRGYPDPMSHLFSSTHNRDHSHYWAVHKWVEKHHIAHWAQKLLLFQSIMQHAPVFYQPSVTPAMTLKYKEQTKSLLPPISGIVFQDSDGRTSDHEEILFQLSLESSLGETSRAYASGMSRARFPRGFSKEEDAEEDESTFERRMKAAAQFRKQYIPRFVEERSLWRENNKGKIIWNEDLHANRFSTAIAPLHRGSSASVDESDEERTARIRKWHIRRQELHARTQKSKKMSAEEEKTQIPVSEAAYDLPISNEQYTCFSRVSFTPVYGELALHEQDSRRWKALMRNYFYQLGEKLKENRRTDRSKALVATGGDKISLVKTQDVPSAISSGPSGLGTAAVGSSLTTQPSIAQLAAADGPNSCPPRRVTLLFRHNRKILNYKVLLEILSKKLGIPWQETVQDENSAANIELEQFIDEARAAGKIQPDVSSDVLMYPGLQYTQIDDHSTSYEQFHLFSSTGLMLSSHSSQLINIMFSPSNSAAMEISPEFYNNDFVRYAFGMGVKNYFYFLGGTKIYAQGHDTADVEAAKVNLEKYEAAVKATQAPSQSGATKPKLVINADKLTAAEIAAAEAASAAAGVDPSVVALASSPRPEIPELQTAESNQAMTNCLEQLNQVCSGRGYCVTKQYTSLCPVNPSNRLKNLNFDIVDLERFAHMIDVAITSIEKHCDGKWLNGFKEEENMRQSVQKMMQEKRTQK